MDKTMNKPKWRTAKTELRMAFFTTFTFSSMFNLNKN
jgi:hypothetical protein